MLTLAVAGLTLQPAQAAVRPALPKSVLYAEKPHRSGDWILQCDSSRSCRIIGVVRKSGSDADARAIVMIERGRSKGTMAAVTFAFIDDDGFASAVRPADGWRLYARGVKRTPTPLRLDLSAEADERLFGTGVRQSHDVVEALLRWPASVIRERGKLVSRMPKGNLRRLFGIMDRIQHPKKPLSAEEQAIWMREYHFAVVRAKAADNIAAPESIALACDTQTYNNGQEAWRLDKGYLLWIVKCPEGAKLFTQAEGKEPQPSLLTDDKGKDRPAHNAVFDPANSTVELSLAKKGRSDCGRRLRFGYTRNQGFGMIEDRQMPYCRGIPAEYWPAVWSPNSWKLID